MQVFNTLGRTLESFTPDGTASADAPGKVGIYVCGPTVQARPHIGHGRAAVAFDVIRRYLSWLGHDVTYVQNVTDVEDKIIAAAEEEGVPSSDLALRYQKVFEDAYAGLGVLPPDLAPRATEHIPEMIELIEQLIDRDHAYEAGGDVYYAVRTFADYGKLSGRVIDDLRSGARIEPGELKRDPLDFALWKAAKPGEPSWESPWGDGRPGWHIECSAMARKYLGGNFTIHAGGTDLIFPHHENEIAQSEAGYDEPFTRYWLHNGLVNLGGLKMSKSTGHVVDLIEALEEFPPQAVRLFYLRTHYRKPVDFTDEAMADAVASLERLWAFRRRVSDFELGTPDEQVMDDFREMMGNDFDNAGALAVLFEVVREGNRRMDDGATDAIGDLAAAFDEMLAVLGLEEGSVDLSDVSEELNRLGTSRGIASIDPFVIVEELLELRIAARADRDWGTADAIRDQLAEIGIAIEDGADGTRWHRR